MYLLLIALAFYCQDRFLYTEYNIGSLLRAPFGLPSFSVACIGRFSNLAEVFGQTCSSIDSQGSLSIIIFLQPLVSYHIIHPSNLPTSLLHTRQSSCHSLHAEVILQTHAKRLVSNQYKPIIVPVANEEKAKSHSHPWPNTRGVGKGLEETYS